MKRLGVQSLPRARKDDLVTRQIPGELLVYDLKRHKAYCLNQTAAAVWKNSDGKHTVSDLAAELQKDQQSPVDERIVWLALDQLERSCLLQTKAAKPIDLPVVTRRNLIRAGIATAIALPLVTMIAAPTAQAAGTPITNAACTARLQSDPGGCGANPCSDSVGRNCVKFAANKCKCG
jgi:Coenzyme PQQ synthesis protein D (PqqD)